MRKTFNRRLLVLAVVALLTVAVFAVAAIAESTCSTEIFATSAKFANAGDPVALTVSYRNNDVNGECGQIDLTYDSAKLEFVSVDWEDAGAEKSVSTEDGKVSLAWANGTAIKSDVAEGDIFTVNFTTKVSGTAKVEIDVVAFGNTTGFVAHKYEVAGTSAVISNTEGFLADDFASEKEAIEAALVYAAEADVTLTLSEPWVLSEDLVIGKAEDVTDTLHTITITGSSFDTAGFDVTLYGNYIFKDIELNGNDAYNTSNAICIAKGSGTFLSGITVADDAKRLNVCGENLTVSSGKYRDVAANIHGCADVIENTTLIVNGDTDVDYLLAGSMNGSAKGGLVGESDLTIDGNVVVNEFILGGGWWSDSTVGSTTTFKSTYTGTLPSACKIYVAGVVSNSKINYVMNVEGGTYATPFLASRTSGSSTADYTSTSTLNISGGKFTSAFYCGANIERSASFVGTSNVNISGGEFSNNFYAGGKLDTNKAVHKGTVNLNITGGTIKNFNGGVYFQSNDGYTYEATHNITIGGTATVGASKLNLGSLYLTNKADNYKFTDNSTVNCTIEEGITITGPVNLVGRVETEHADSKKGIVITIGGNHTLTANGVAFTGDVLGFSSLPENKFTVDITGTNTFDLTGCTLSGSTVALGGYFRGFYTTEASKTGKYVARLTNTNYTKGTGYFLAGFRSMGSKTNYVTDAEVYMTNCNINASVGNFGSNLASANCIHSGNVKAVVDNCTFSYENKAHYMGSYIGNNGAEHRGDLDLTFNNSIFLTSWSFGFFGGSYLIGSKTEVANSSRVVSHTGDIKVAMDGCSIGAPTEGLTAETKKVSKYVYGGCYSDANYWGTFNHSGDIDFSLKNMSFTNVLWGGSQMNQAAGKGDFNYNVGLSTVTLEKFTTTSAVYGGPRFAGAVAKVDSNSKLVINPGCSFNTHVVAGTQYIAGTDMKLGSSLVINGNSTFKESTYVCAGSFNISAQTVVTNIEGDCSLDLNGRFSTATNLTAGHVGCVCSTGDFTLNVYDGTDVWGACSNFVAGPYMFNNVFKEGTDVVTTDGSFAYNVNGNVTANIYGGTVNKELIVAGYRTFISGDVVCNIYGGTTNGVYGLSRGVGSKWYNYVGGNVYFNISGGENKANVYGGGDHKADTNYTPKNGCNKICGECKMTISGGIFKGNIIASGSSGSVGTTTVKFVGADYDLSPMIAGTQYIWCTSVGGATQSTPAAGQPMILDLTEVTLNTPEEIEKYETYFCSGNPHADTEQWWLGPGTTQGYKTVLPAIADANGITMDASSLAGQSVAAGSKLDLSGIKFSATFNHTIRYNGKTADGSDKQGKQWKEMNSVSNIDANLYRDAMTFISAQGNVLADGKVGYNTTGVSIVVPNLVNTEVYNITVSNKAAATDAILNNFGYLGLSINPAKSGLRVRAILTPELLAATAEKEGYVATKYGMLMTKSNDAELNLEAGKTAIYSVGGDGEDVYKDEADGSRTFAAVVTGIGEANYETKIYYRPFLEFADANGDTSVVYATKGLNGGVSDITANELYDATAMAYGPSLTDGCQKFYDEWLNAEEGDKEATYYITTAKSFIDTVLKLA